jgi:hypothetical protein
MNLNNPRARLRNCALAIAAVVALTVAALLPTGTEARSYDIDDPEDLVEQLIKMDEDDIADLRADLVDARADIREAISDIEDAKDDVKDAPGGEAISRVAFRVAGAAVSSATGAALAEAHDALNEAEQILDGRRDELGMSEYRETRGAIDMIRGELTEIEATLQDLLDALRDS